MTEATTPISRSSDALALSFYRRPFIAPDKTIYPPTGPTPYTKRDIQDEVTRDDSFFTPLAWTSSLEFTVGDNHSRSKLRGLCAEKPLEEGPHAPKDYR